MKPQTAGAGLLAWLAAWVAGTACQVLAALPVPPQCSGAALALAVAAALASGLLRRLRHGRWLPASGPLALALLVFSGAAAGWGAAGAHMAARMARQGWAWSYGRGRGPYAEQEAAARQARQGVFAHVAEPERPADFRRRHGPCTRAER